MTAGDEVLVRGDDRDQNAGKMVPAIVIRPLGGGDWEVERRSDKRRFAVNERDLPRATPSDPRPGTTVKPGPTSGVITK